MALGEPADLLDGGLAGAHGGEPVAAAAAAPAQEGRPNPHGVQPGELVVHEGGGPGGVDGTRLEPGGVDGLHHLLEEGQLLRRLPALFPGGVDLGVDAREGHVGEIPVHGQHLLRLGGQEAAVAHAGVHLNVGLHHGGAGLGQAVEGHPRVVGADGALHIEVDELLQLLPVGGGAEHEDLLVHKAGLPQRLGLLRLADGEAADALGPEQLGHLGDAGAPGVSREDAVDGGPSGTALHHPDVLLYGRLLNDQHPHGTAPFFSLLGRREIRLPPV